jgi:predicted Zn-dependent protease
MSIFTYVHETWHICAGCKAEFFCANENCALHPEKHPENLEKKTPVFCKKCRENSDKTSL